MTDATTTLDGLPTATWLKLNEEGQKLDGLVTSVLLRPSKSWDNSQGKYVDVPVKTKDGQDRDEIVLFVAGDDGENYAFAFLAGSPFHRELKKATADVGTVVSQLAEETRHLSVKHTGRDGNKPTSAHLRSVVVA